MAQPTLGYSHDKYIAALFDLAASTGTIQERLRDAYEERAAHVLTLDGQTGPDVDQSLHDRMRALDETVGGPEASAVAAMSDHDAEQAASVLVGIALDLDRAIQESDLR